MRLDEAFERVVVINLPFKEDRKKRLLAHFAESGIADPKRVHWERAICGDWTPPPCWWGSGNGAWGCLMSHLRVGQDAVHDKVASYCVLEDDVVFCPDAPVMLEAFMREVPQDWGQVYLGGQFLHKEPERISPWVMRPFNVNRTHAFAVSAGTIPKFLQHIMHAPDYFNLRVDDQGTTALDHNGFHVDHQLGRAHERQDWNTYAPTWWLAGQDNGSSNISGRTNPRLWWNWRDRGLMLPFFFLPSGASAEQREVAREYLHVGFNAVGDTLVDTGLDKPLTDEELASWLFLIAGEAMDRWKLPGFETPPAFPDLPERVQRIWEAGVLTAEKSLLDAVADYPFNGFCGGVSGIERVARTVAPLERQETVRSKAEELVEALV